MKVTMIKQPGGLFCPASDMEAERLIKFKTGEPYVFDIKLQRNPAFLRKVMAFFKFCFEHWNGGEVYSYCSEIEQFERFRKDLTILAGFYIQSVRLDGSIRTEAKSLSFASMSEEEFEECYHALINASIKHIFKSADSKTETRLLDFF